MQPPVASTPTVKNSNAPVGQPAKPFVTTAPDPVEEKKRLNAFKNARDEVEKEHLKPPESQDWVPCSMSAVDLAEKVAQATQSLDHTGAELDSYVETPEGRGEMHQALEIENKKQFKVDFVQMDNRPQGSTIVANGSEKMLRVGSQWYPPVAVSKPLEQARLSDDEMADDWVRNFSHLLYQGLTDGRDSWVPVVKRWVQPGSGYTVKVESRNIKFKGHNYLNYRIVASRGSGTARGGTNITVVVDGYRYLPVSIWAFRTNADGKDWKSTWSAHYYFKQDFPASAFVAPFSMKASAETAQAQSG